MFAIEFDVKRSTFANYPTTSSQAEEWFSGIISSASLYDLNNIHSLRKIIPEYIYISEQNEQYILFANYDFNV